MKDKVVVITGASSGIGMALAYECAGLGARVVAAARNADALQKVAAEILAGGGQCLAVPTDVSDEDACRRLIEETIAHYGTVDVLVNNAGVSMRAPFADLDLKVIKRLMDVNFWGTVYCTKYAFPYLLKNKGSLVGVSSIMGYKGIPYRTGYSASKFAIHGLLEAIRVETLKAGLHVLIACPGYTVSNIRNTALTADGSVQGDSLLDESKLMSAEEVAKLIARAIVNRKRTLTLTSQGKLTVFVNKFFPGFVDKMAYKVISKEGTSK